MDLTALISLEVLFENKFRVRKRSLKREISSFDKIFKDIKISSEEKIFFVSFGPHSIGIYYNDKQELDPQIVRRLYTLCHLSEVNKEKISSYQSFFQLFYADGPAEPINQYRILLMISGGLIKMGEAICVANIKAATAIEVAALNVSNYPENMRSLNAIVSKLPISVLFIGIGRFPFEGQIGYRTFGAEFLNLKNLHCYSSFESSMNIMNMYNTLFLHQLKNKTLFEVGDTYNHEDVMLIKFLECPAVPHTVTTELSPILHLEFELLKDVEEVKEHVKRKKEEYEEQNPSTLGNKMESLNE
eukprot:TRINITY_DN3235_c0_g1_i1.p1 TRINITY_DN3235_c0_g1~~TRINITY_DN3235_c0_g1_i1.p1  ORF type:complete len:315 (+),score=88.18 TRINITY_DN3235_c0_g1_i1:44-946(+)